MTKEKKEKKDWTRVHDSVKDIFGDYHSKGIEIAFNVGIPVEMPPIKGLSPTVKVIDLEESIDKVLEDPTEEEKERWKGMTREEIREDIESYIRSYAEERGIKLRESSNKEE